MASSGWIRRIVVLFAAISVCLGQAHASDDSTEVEAVWHKQSVNFEYHGYSTYYTCSGLREKLRRILINLGARDSVSLHGYACNDETGSARFQIVLESPVVATAQNVEALTTYSTEKQLVARTRGERLATAEDLERFPAHWKTVSFSRDRRMRLDPGDCELVEQIRSAILPRLAVQIVSDRLHCSPFGNARPPRLTVVALIAQSDSGMK